MTEPTKPINLNAPIDPAESLIEYPSDFPIKIMGATQDQFAQTIVELVIMHDPDFHAGKMKMRPSSGGNYLALTVTVRATSREQLDNLYRALSSHPMVKVVL
jgi:putative lipoic acid-binding regulatory protein